eukprot:621238-Prymnesium_polylepis.1
MRRTCSHAASSHGAAASSNDPPAATRTTAVGSARNAGGTCSPGCRTTNCACNAGAPSGTGSSVVSSSGRPRVHTSPSVGESPRALNCGGCAAWSSACPREAVTRRAMRMMMAREALSMRGETPVPRRTAQ